MSRRNVASKSNYAHLPESLGYAHGGKEISEVHVKHKSKGAIPKNNLFNVPQPPEINVDYELNKQESGQMIEMDKRAKNIARLKK